MKTKDFIKILQEADPSGEGYIRMSGGIPSYAEAKEGYWDGAYTYIDEDGNYVTSIKNYKVDITCTDIDDFVEGLVGWDKDFKFEDIKDKFKFELDNYGNVNQRNERVNKVLNRAEICFDEHINIITKMWNENLVESNEKYDKGWTYFQNKLVDTEGSNHFYYTWKIYDENGKEMGSNIHNVEGIKDSGLYEPIDNNVKEGYYQWLRK